MRKNWIGMLAALALCGFAGSASAGEPTGFWLVADGNARIRIGPCADAYWGVIDWAVKPQELDIHNPDPAKRNRTVVGIPILLAMKASGPDEWSGEVYNAQNGKTYMAKISLLNPDELKITGCVLGGLFCGGETWARAKDVDFAPVPKPGPNNRGQVARNPRETCPAS